MAHRIILAEVRTVLSASVTGLPRQRRAAVEFVRARRGAESDGRHGRTQICNSRCPAAR